MDQCSLNVLKVWHLTKLSGGGAGQYALRLSRALHSEGVESAVLIAEGEVLGGADLLIAEPSFLRSSATRAWVAILRRATNATAFHTGFRLNRWQPKSPIMPEDIVHLHGMTGWIGFGGLEAMIPAGTRVFWTAHDLWMMSGGCVVYTGCEKFLSLIHI